jgi:3-oxoacyl-[acyl-carrier-protein] synthase-3
VLRLGTADEPGALLGFDLGSDGAGADLITVRAGGSEQRSTGLPAELADTYFRMHGKPVFYRAVRRMTESALTVVKQVGWEIDEIDRFVAHQANTRILNNCVSELGLPQDRLVVNIDRVGNTVAASVPLALAQAAADGGLRPGHRTVLTGFGGGLTWGSTALNWPELTVEDPITGTHWQHDIT